MLDTIQNAILAVTDPLLGWLLWLPRDLALLIVAVLTGLILTLVRRWTTDQAYLAQCADDKRRLKELMGEAARAKDREAKARIRRTVGQLGGVQFKAEGRPLLYSIVPIALVATWAFARLAFLPIAPGDAVTVNAYFDTPHIGHRAHLVPQPDVTAENGAIQRVRAVEEDDFAFGVFDGMAAWVVRAEPRPAPYTLTIRYEGGTFEIPLEVGGRTYANPIILVADPRVEMLTADLTEYRPLGFIPGVPMLMLQPWIIGYLILVLPLSFLLKRILHVA